MGWRAITKAGEILLEETHGRPVADGQKGKLAVIAQEDYGHSVAVDLLNGIIAIDYEHLAVQNGTVELTNPKTFLWICHDTVVAGELQHITPTLEPFMEEQEDGTKVQRIDNETKELVFTRTDVTKPIMWRPIWFTRWINFIPTKIIGAQATLPKAYGGKNVKKMVMLFPDGRIGIY
jgi:hypothetical protein